MGVGGVDPRLGEDGADTAFDQFLLDEREAAVHLAVQPVGAAPNTADLKNRFCANCATAIIFNQWPTWGPDGMPCVAQLSSDGSTTVCNSAGGPRAYWTFFQSQATSEWAAVTITPAGRVRAWTYGANSGTWAPQ